MCPHQVNLSPNHQRTRLSPIGFININPALILHGSSSHSDCWPKTFQAFRLLPTSASCPVGTIILSHLEVCNHQRKPETTEQMALSDVPSAALHCSLPAGFLKCPQNVLSQSPLRITTINPLSSLSTTHQHPALTPQATPAEAPFIPESEFRLQSPLVLPS